MTSSPLPPLVLGLLLFTLVPALALGAEPAQPPATLQSLAHSVWLREVEPLLLPAERAAFDALEAASSREVFIERFWDVRDPTPATPRNELRERWRAGAVAAAELEDGIRSRRAPQEAVLRLLGSRPRLLHTISCPPLPDLEVWYYSRGWAPPLARGVGSREPFFLLFARTEEGGPFRRVTRRDVAKPWDGGSTLRERLDEVVRSKRCLEGAPGTRRAVGDLLRAFDGALGWRELVAAAGVPTPPEGWFQELLRAEPEGAPGPAAAGGEPRLTFAFPGRIGAETVVRGLLELHEISAPVGEEASAAPTEHGLAGVVLLGRVIAHGDVRDSFLYTFNALGRGLGDRPALTFERSLTPNTYLLELRVEDLQGNRLWATSQRLVVPRVRDESSRPTDPSLLDAADLLLVPTDATLSLSVEGSGLLVGEVPVRALYSGLGAGLEVEAVRFYLDGRFVGEVADAPYELTLDLGEAPRRHLVRAVAVDERGRALAEDRVRVNAGPHRFAVRLAHPADGSGAEGDRGTFTARVEVVQPHGVPLDRLELEVNGEPRATLFAPPFVQTLALPEEAEVVYVRAVAHLTDGRREEDAVLVRGGPNVDEIDVQLVELYTTVLDGRRPVTDLDQDDFTIVEDGTPRPLHHFAKLGQVPLHVCLAVDASQSMKNVMQTVQASATSFLERVLGPADRASVVSFDHRVRLVAPLTADLEDLRRSVGGIDAVGGTALFDAVVMSLHYLGGVEGKRAVVVLSDGHDQHSHFDREDALELARRSGVAIYTIALGDDRRLWTLRKLAHETGGRAFSVRRVEELPEVYRRIEQELRSQYLLTFQAPETGEGGYRKLDVRLSRPGLEPRTRSGYYRE